MEQLLNWLAASAIPAIVGAITSLGGMFLFRKQDKDSKELDNKAKEYELMRKRADEWRELYEDQKRQREDRDRIIEEKNDIIRRQNKQIYDLQVDNAKKDVRCAALECQKCEDFGCLKRKPPLKEQLEESDTKLKNQNDSDDKESAD